ncbi:hypothetical protein lbkm_3219 [Lachnospiraceae bacterium KM106-2]|nr:hypothetical protein lbkm_3219 [Lachnospiraceae bacterium KM106-2]
MDDGRYVISEVVKLTKIKSHTIRYWEDELELIIDRDAMGHRIYTDEDVELFLTIKELKDKGFQLKAIKMLLPTMNEILTLDAKSMLNLRDEMNQKVLNGIEIPLKKESKQEPIVENSEKEVIPGVEHAVKKDTKTEISDIPSVNSETIVSVQNDKMTEFKKIMNDLIAQALRDNSSEISEAVSTVVSGNVVKEMDYLLRIQEEREEERFRKLDDTIRGVQRTRQEVAATTSKKRKRKHLFRK